MNARRAAIGAALRRLAPRIPAFDHQAVLDHACASRGLKTASPEAAAWLSLVAHVRHAYTEYDHLLADGYDIESARYFVLAPLTDVLAAWGCRKPVGGAAATQKDIDS